MDVKEKIIFGKIASCQSHYLAKIIQFTNGQTLEKKRINNNWNYHDYHNICVGKYIRLTYLNTITSRNVEARKYYLNRLFKTEHMHSENKHQIKLFVKGKKD